MLGDLFYEAIGKITSKRVLDLDGPKIESSYFLEGIIRVEIEVIEIGTFTSIPITDRIFSVEGKNIVTVKGNEKEIVTVKTQSISKLIRDSSSKVVYGSNFYHSSTTGKLSFLNNLVGVHEASVDNDGNIMYKVCEWKEPLTNSK